MSKAEEKAQAAYPAWRNGIGDEFNSNSAYYGFIEGYHQAEKDLRDISWIKEISGVKEMSRAKEESLKAYPPQSIAANYDTINRRDAFEYGYLKAEKDLELTWEDTKDEFLSEFLAKTLSRKLGINRMPECEKEECNKTYTPEPYSPDRSKYPYFEAFKEGFLSAMSIAEDILVKMFNKYNNLTKD